MRKAMLLLAVFGLASLLWAADPFVGTWKMNPAKSKSEVQSLTMTIEAQGNRYTFVQDIIYPDGKSIHSSWISEYDGKDHPVTGDPNADTVSGTKPNPNTVKYVYKKNGKVVESGEAVISKDGKTYTSVGSRKEANGQTITYTIVMERQ